ncbi:MAG: hypothetical protein HY710_10205, partial [Candidatus Latescibacteria bacterium]|nr:hypothetical protein [Candidatus Latescibacterota bacterium]
MNRSPDLPLELEGALCPLGAFERASGHSFGGKADSLDRLVRMGFPVPEGFGIAAEVYRATVGGIGLDRLWQEAGWDALGQRQPGTHERLNAVCARLRAAIERAPLPDVTQRAIGRLYAALGDEVSVAVRSSAVGEDGEAHSYAGQHTSVLRVRGSDGVLEAVRRCWASLFSPHALQYRLRLGVGPVDGQMGVVVQRMVEAQAAGVGFSADPAGRLDGRVLIDAVAGLADSLVSGERTPAEVEVDPDGRVRRRSAGEGVLSDALAQEVAAVVRRIAAAFGTQQDVEWAYDGSRVWVVQARPLTIPVARPDEGTKVVIWTGANLQEAIPEPLTPLSEQLTLRFVDLTIRLSFEAFGIPNDPDDPSLMVYRGRFYMNYSTFTSWTSVLPGVDLSQIFLQYGDPPRLIDRLAFRRRSKLRYLLRLPAALLTMLGWWLFADRRIAKVVVKNEEKIRQVIRLAVPETPDEALGRIFEMSGPDHGVIKAFGIVGGLAMSHLAFAQKAAMKAIPGLDSATAWASTAGIEMASAEMGRRLAQMADLLRDDPPCLQRLAQALTDGQSGVRVLDEPGFAGLRAQFDAFMQACGHRTENEAELAQPRWQERPDDVLRRVIQLARAPRRDVSPDAVRSTILDRVSGLRRWLIRMMIERAQFWQ